jgi:hypothetical protein
MSFTGEEFQKSLHSFQSILDATKPLAEQLAPDQKVKNAIAKCIEALQVLLSQAENADEQWAAKQEENDWKQETNRQQRRSRIQTLYDIQDKRSLTLDEEEELAELETEEGMR